MSATLFKLFLGPAGTVTRLHADAGEAHGWLAQVWGAKLFVLYPPTDAPHLRVLPNEVRCSSCTALLNLLLLSADLRALSPKQRSAMWSRWRRRAMRAPLDRRRRRTWRFCSPARRSSCRGACKGHAARGHPASIGAVRMHAEMCMRSSQRLVALRGCGVAVAHRAGEFLQRGRQFQRGGPHQNGGAAPARLQKRGGCAAVSAEVASPRSREGGRTL